MENIDTFPLFDLIMHRSLNPFTPEMAASRNYEQYIVEQIVDAEKDRGYYSISFVANRHLKEKYYFRLMCSETIAYCNEWLDVFAAEEDSNILALRRDKIVDKHLKACMRRLHEKMLDAGLHRQELLLPEKGVEVDTETRCNAYVLHLLKVCLAKVYLDFQHALLPVVSVKLTEAELYCNYFGESPNCKTWLKFKADARVDKNEAVARTANVNKPKTDATLPKTYAPSAEPSSVAASPTAEQVPIYSPAKEDFYLKVSDVCKITGLAERTIRKYLTEGKLMGTQPNGKMWKIKQSDLHAFMKKNSNNKTDIINRKIQQE